MLCKIVNYLKHKKSISIVCLNNEIAMFPKNHTSLYRLQNNIICYLCQLDFSKAFVTNYFALILSNGSESYQDWRLITNTYLSLSKPRYLYFMNALDF